MKKQLSKFLLKASRGIPYAFGAKVLEWFCKQRWAQALFAKNGLNLTRQFLPLAASSLDEAEVLQRSMAANFMGSWRLLALDRATPDVFTKWVSINGLSHVDDAYDKDRGLIVVNGHYGVPRMAPLVLSRQGRRVLSLEAVDLFTQLGIAENADIEIMQIGGKENTPLLREVYKARQALETGAVLHLAPDGSFGSSGVRLPLHGRWRPFAAGFAELAVRTGAQVVPVFASIAASGHLTVDFLEPFDSGNEQMSHKERVDLLIKQYVKTLEDRYSQDPGNIRWIHFRRFFALQAPEDSSVTEARPVESVRR